MSYKNIYDVLPKKLVEQIQEHIDGVKLYIPKKPNNRIAWGSNTDTKELIFYAISKLDRLMKVVSQFPNCRKYIFWQKKRYKKLYIQNKS